MINLQTFKENASKYLHRIMIEVQPQDVVEICERAMAAEELAEARLLLLHRATHNLSNADTEIRELKAQLVELEKQEPAGVTSNMFGPMGFTTATFDSSEVPVNTNVYVKPVHLSAGKPTLAVVVEHKPQRITEQDAREIVLNSFWFIKNFKDANGSNPSVIEWHEAEGKRLLAKLNEHREPNLETHNLNHLELIKAKQYSFMNCALCSHSVNVAVLVRSTNCSIHICESCAQAVNREFK